MHASKKRTLQSIEQTNCRKRDFYTDGYTGHLFSSAAAKTEKKRMATSRDKRNQTYSVLDRADGPVSHSTLLSKRRCHGVPLAAVQSDSKKQTQPIELDVNLYEALNSKAPRERKCWRKTKRQTRPDGHRPGSVRQPPCNALQEAQGGRNRETAYKKARARNRRKRHTESKGSGNIGRVQRGRGYCMNNVYRGSTRSVGSSLCGQHTVGRPMTHHCD